MTIVEQGPATVPEVLDAAAEFVATHDWAQKPGETEELNFEYGPWCAAMAIQMVLPAARNYDDVAGMRAATGLIEAAVAFADRHFGQRLLAWNDAEGRTKAEVVTGLREAAAAARAEQ